MELTLIQYEILILLLRMPRTVFYLAARYGVTEGQVEEELADLFGKGFPIEVTSYRYECFYALRGAR